MNGDPQADPARAPFPPPRPESPPPAAPSTAPSTAAHGDPLPPIVSSDPTMRIPMPPPVSAPPPPTRPVPAQHHADDAATPQHRSSQADDMSTDADLRAYRAAPEPSSPAPIVVGIIAVLAVAGGIIGFLLYRGDSAEDRGSNGSPQPSGSAPLSALSTGSAASGPVTTAPIATTPGPAQSEPVVVPSDAPPPAVTPPATAPSTASGDPAAQLQQWITEGTAQVESSLLGQWVPQISSKKVGTVDDGITYQLGDIVALHQRLVDEHRAIMIASDDYVYRTRGLFVSIVPRGFATADEALEFCSGNGFDRQHCYAKLLTHDASIDPTVKFLP